MDKGAYAIIRQLIELADPEIELQLMDGTSQTLAIDSAMLLTELDRDQRLEREADWLAEQLHENEERVISIFADDYIWSAQQWREAARKAVEGDDGNP